MFTAVAQKNLADAEKYFDEHLAQNDYYAAGEIRPGQWIGAGAEQLGLKGEVAREQFHALCENENPETSKSLTPRQLKQGQRRVFYDFTCSAPKSVSVLAVTLTDERLVTAHEEAARIAFRELETFAGTRVRKRGNQKNRITGNLAAAAFTHTSSRALDPQLHTHFTVFNATFDQAEHCWKALEARGMYDAIRYGTAVYRNELAKRVLQIGYRITPAKHGFEIEGVSGEVLKRFSKRAQQRDAVVKELEQKLGRKLSNNAVSLAVHQSRAEKIKGISTAEVRERQLGQLSSEEQKSLQTLRTSARPIRLPRIALVENQALNHAVGHVFERKSVVPEHELLNVALSHRLGAVDLNHLRAAVKHLPDLVKTERGFSTREIVATELNLIQTVNAGCDSVAPLHPFYRPADWLGEDQRRAIYHTVVSVEGNSLKVQRADGSESVFPMGAGSACDVGEKRKLQVAAGDKLLLQANAGTGRKHFVNGELVEVKRFAGEAIILTDGRTIPANYRTFTHGYAVTSHAAQGKTVDEVLIVAWSRSLPAVHQEQFYVSISRGRERCQVFTDDAELLRSHVTRSSARLAAIEAMPARLHRDFLKTVLQRGHRFLKQFRQRIAQIITTDTTERSSHEIKPTEHQRTATRHIGF